MLDRLAASLLPVILAVVVTAGACSSESSSPPERPASTARLIIESPTPSQLTGPSVMLRLRVDGGTVVQRTTGRLTPTEGHVHVKLDGDLVTMAYTTEQELNDLGPGPHTVEAEFVAVDHAPFKNRPRATVLFTVQ